MMSKVTPKKHTEVKTQDSSTVVLWIDAYTEIFSDFDPRPFSERIISDDFMNQVKHVLRETEDRILILKLLVPEGGKKEGDEKIIRRRLETYFHNKFEQKRSELQKLQSRGFYFVLSGVALMLTAGYISFLKVTGLAVNVLLVLFEPGGWFLFWTGLENLFSASQLKKAEVQFYSRLAHTHVEFGIYKSE